jgi:MYXO-CTERM domain-containing protein
VGTPSGKLAAFGDTTGAAPDAGTAGEDAGSTAVGAGAEDAAPPNAGPGSTGAADSGSVATPYPTTGSGEVDSGASWLAPTHETSFGPVAEHSGGCASAPGPSPFAGGGLWLLGAMAALAVRRRTIG